METLTNVYYFISAASYADRRWEESKTTSSWATWLGHRTVALIEYAPLIGLIALKIDLFIHKHFFSPDIPSSIEEKPIIQESITNTDVRIPSEETPHINNPIPPNPLDLSMEQTIALTMVFQTPIHYLLGIPYGIPLKTSLFQSVAWTLGFTTLRFFNENEVHGKETSIEERLISSFEKAIPLAVPAAIKYYALHATPANAFFQAYASTQILLSSFKGTVKTLQHANKENYPTVLRNLAVHGITSVYAYYALRYAILASSSTIPDNSDFVVKYIQPVATEIFSSQTMETINNYSDYIQQLVFTWAPPFMGLKTCPNHLTVSQLHPFNYYLRDP